MSPKHCDGIGWQGDGTAPAFRLRRLQAESGFGFLDRVLHIEHAAIEVGIDPMKPEKFAAT
jgi:hypothetical protein